MKSWAAAVVVILLPAVVTAQDVPPRIPPGEDRTVVVSSGDRAPFTGVLLDTDTSIRHLHRLEWYEFRLELERTSHEAALVALRESYARERTALDASFGREIEGLRLDLREQAAAAVEASAPPEFWETSPFGFIMGVVLSAVLAGAAIAIGVAL